MIAYGLVKRIIKKKTYSTGTVILCEINPTLFAVLVYDPEGNLTASTCDTVFTNSSKAIKASVMKNMNKVYKEVQNKLMNKELVRN